MQQLQHMCPIDLYRLIDSLLCFHKMYIITFKKKNQPVINFAYYWACTVLCFYVQRKICVMQPLDYDILQCIYNMSSKIYIFLLYYLLYCMSSLTVTFFCSQQVEHQNHLVLYTKPRGLLGGCRCSGQRMEAGWSAFRKGTHILFDQYEVLCII